MATVHVIRPRNETAKDPSTSPRTPIILGLAFLLSLKLTANIAAGKDPDIWWHVRTGDLILQQHGLPHNEPFSWTMAGMPYIAYSWLFEVIASWIYKLGDMLAITLFTIGMAAVISVVMFLLLARKSGDPRYKAVAMALVMMTAAPLMTPRPWLFTMLFYVLELHLVLRARETGRAHHLIWLLPLFAAWANIHVQFVYGFALLGALCLEASFARPLSRFFESVTTLKPTACWSALGGCILATLVNPYGSRLYLVVAQYTFQKVAVDFVSEMQAPHFRYWPEYLTLAAVAGLGAILARRLRQSSPTLLLVVLVATVLAFRAQRDIWFLTFTLAPMIPFPGKSFRLGWKKWAMVAAIVVVGMVGFTAYRVRPSVLAKARQETYPAAACDFVQRNGMKGKIFNSYDWGGYLIWRLPESKVSMDGRANVYGDEALKRYIDTFTAQKNWNTDPAMQESDFAVLETAAPVTQLLRQDKRFQLLYEDDHATVFKHVK